MSEVIIEGGKQLRGVIDVNGAKNASLPIMAATLLTEGKTVLDRVPRLTDVETLAKILRSLGVSVERTSSHTMELKPGADIICDCPHDYAISMRAGICVLGPLLAKTGRANVPLPGGCVLGDRPVDLHLKGLRAMGADIRQKGGFIMATADRLKGARIYLGGPHGSTVLGTANIMMAATLADGVTTIEHAASEPEICDLADYLQKCGASISGAGTHTIRVEGVKRLEGCLHHVIADRIEAGTYACALAISGGEITLRNVRPGHMAALRDVMESMGVDFELDVNTIKVCREGPLKATDCTALPYPGLPTDMQPQILSVLTASAGTSVVTDSVYPERFTHVGELVRLGADIVRQGPQAVIRGAAELTGAYVRANDLRGGAALIVAGLGADGTTVVSGIEHVDRGYEGLDEKLFRLGANIARKGASSLQAGQLQLPFEGHQPKTDN